MTHGELNQASIDERMPKLNRMTHSEREGQSPPTPGQGEPSSPRCPRRTPKSAAPAAALSSEHLARASLRKNCFHRSMRKKAWLWCAVAAMLEESTPGPPPEGPPQPKEKRNSTVRCNHLHWCASRARTLSRSATSLPLASPGTLGRRSKFCRLVRQCFWKASSLAHSTSKARRRCLTFLVDCMGNVGGISAKLTQRCKHAGVNATTSASCVMEQSPQCTICGFWAAESRLIVVVGEPSGR